MTRLLFLLALAVGFGWQGLAAQAVSAPAHPEPMLRPGDRVNIQVWRNPELSGAFLVADNGALQHPLYSNVAVAGVPMDVVRERIHQFVTRFEAAPNLLVVPEFLVYVGGAVRDQNQQFFPAISVGQAITRAGGSTTPGQRYRVRLIRDGQDQRVNLDGSVEAAQMLQQPIHSGDQILIEERPTFSRRYLSPTLQVLQTVTSLVSTYVFFHAVFK